MRGAITDEGRQTDAIIVDVGEGVQSGRGW